MTEWRRVLKRAIARRVSASLGEASSAISPPGRTAFRIATATAEVSRISEAGPARRGTPSAWATLREISTPPSMNEATSINAPGSSRNPSTRAEMRISSTSGRSW